MVSSQRCLIGEKSGDTATLETAGADVSGLQSFTNNNCNLWPGIVLLQDDSSVVLHFFRRRKIYMLLNNWLLLRTRQLTCIFKNLDFYKLWLSISLENISFLSFLLLCTFRRNYLCLFEKSTVTFCESGPTLDSLSIKRKRKLWFKWTK